jgi:2-dehydro-3-deoxyglucarate aldolase/4-hydroxy-2-oxoheptanedioate aldolase
MENANKFKDKLRRGEVCLGTVISFNDPTIVEALSTVLDFVWIDAEHNAMTLEIIQGHLMATKGSDTAALVRVAWNDPVLIKPVLDIGADGIIVPMVRSAEDVRRAVAACKYPPEGIRGYGPRRPAKYGRLGGPEFCRLANESIIVIAQLEHMDAIRDIDEILAVPGLTSIVFGPNDLSGSMGLMAQPNHPEVVAAMQTAIDAARRSSVFVGNGVGGDVEALMAWIDRGIQWITLGNDVSLLLGEAGRVANSLRAELARGAA